MKLARLSKASSKMATDRRRFPRQPAWARAVVRSSHGEQKDGTIADLSSQGCSVRCDAPWLKTGSFVSIGREGKPGLEGIVRWVRNGAAGVEFLRPIPPERTEWLELLESPFDT